MKNLKYYFIEVSFNCPPKCQIGPSPELQSIILLTPEIDSTYPKTLKKRYYTQF